MKVLEFVNVQDLQFACIMHIVSIDFSQYEVERQYSCQCDLVLNTNTCNLMWLFEHTFDTIRVYVHISAPPL